MEKFQAAFEIFQKEIYPDGESAMCSLHEYFDCVKKDRHNCLGCNLADATNWIYNYLARFDKFEEVSEDYTFYLLRLYLLVERVNVVFDIVSLPLEYRIRHFGVFQDVHKWANFIKHPKAFFLVHHPRYAFDGMDGFDSSKYSVIIDQAFVSEFYAGPDHNKKLWDRLCNQTSVAVIYPDPVALTERFCKALQDSIAVIRDNKVYREILNSRTTFEHYFGQPDSRPVPEA